MFWADTLRVIGALKLVNVNVAQVAGNREQETRTASGWPKRTLRNEVKS